MREKLDKIIKSKIFVLVLIILLMISIVIVGTEAWLTWGSEENTNLTMTVGDILDVNFYNGPDINVTDLAPVFNYYDGAKTTIEIIKRGNLENEVARYRINLNISTIDSELANTSFKYKLVLVGSSGDEVPVIEGNFDATGPGSVLALVNTKIYSSKVQYALYFYIDGNMENNPNMINKSLTGRVTISGEAVPLSDSLAADKIINLYNSSTKTSVSQGSVTYNYANIYGDNGGLMNDRLDGTTNSLDGGNVRYYGADPDNYIYFNCDNYGDQSDSTCEKWRIIGVFDGRLKIIREDPLTDSTGSNALLAFDQQKNIDSNSTSSSVDWHTASLQKFLNDKYYDRKSTTNLLYYSGEEGEVQTTLNMSSIGLKNKATRDKIADVVWNYGGISLLTVWEAAENGFENFDFLKFLYTSERGGLKCEDCSYKTIWPGKVALMYLSDYFYGADFDRCTFGNNLEFFDCYSNNYLYEENLKEWTLDPVAEYSDTSSTVDASYTNTLFAVDSCADGAAVRPTLYLEADQEIVGGNGKQNNPYRLSGDNVGNYISNIYNAAPKTRVTNNGIEYNYATSVNLMNDRLGGTTVDLNGGNIRYYGADPDNYIYFNCNDYTRQSAITCERWRIIGVFDGVVKIVRDEPLVDSNNEVASLEWDYMKAFIGGGGFGLSYSNNWHTSSVQRFLNEKYYNREGTTTINYGSVASGYTELNLSVIGLKNVATREKIKEATWYLGGWDSSAVYPNQAYIYERGNNKCDVCVYATTRQGNVGLMYPSDYGYASSSTCAQRLNNYNNGDCKNSNYLYNSNFDQWFITPDSSNGMTSWCLYSSGEVSVNEVIESGFSIRPVVYLSNSQRIVGGSGTKASPYRLS